MIKMRPIKPCFIRDYELCAAEQETGLPLRLAFAALLAVADREGRFRWRPAELKVNCLPYDDLDFSRVLDALVTAGLCVKYGCEGEVYGHIPTFREYRVINAKELASELPAPREGEPVSHASATREPRNDDAMEPAVSAAASAGDMAAGPAAIEHEAPDPSPGEAPPAGPNGGLEDPEPSAGPVDEPVETDPAEPEASPEPEAAPPLNVGGDGLATGADPGLEGADDPAGAGVEQGDIQGGEHGGNGPATAASDEDWSWQQDRELYDEIVAEGLRQGLTEAEAQKQAAAAFGGKVPPPIREPAADLA